MDADAVFKALADPTRRRLLDALHERSGQTLGELCEGLEMRRQSASQHLDLLQSANLISTVRSGRRKLHYLNPLPIHEIGTRWIWKFEESQLSTLHSLKTRAERTAMTATSNANAATVPDYVYTTYIRATADQVWTALTDPAATAQFWGHAQISDWTVGARVDHMRTDGSGVSDAAGRIVEIDPPRHLAFTFDEPARFDDPTAEPSLVSFEIESYRNIVKLTVTQARLNSLEELHAIGQGWPSVLSNFKTLLETGQVLPQAPWEFHAEERAARMARND